MILIISIILYTSNNYSKVILMCCVVEHLSYYSLFYCLKNFLLLFASISVLLLLWISGVMPDPCHTAAEKFRVFRADKSYAVTRGKWYFEFEAVTAGDMRVGWARPHCTPNGELGSDMQAFVFDGSKVRRLK